jgi:hypothetical protein
MLMLPLDKCVFCGGNLLEKQVSGIRWLEYAKIGEILDIV